MRRVFTLIGSCLVLSLVVSPVAGADVTQSSAAIAAGAPLPPAYVLERDGTVTIEGDVVTDCQGYLVGFQETQERLQDEAQAVADECRDLGVPSGDFATGNSEAVLSLGTIRPPEPSAGELPDTGGLSLTSLAGLASGVALICGGLLLRRHKG